MQGLAIGLALGQFFSQLIVVEQNIIEVPFMIKLQIKHILTHLVTRLYNVNNISQYFQSDYTAKITNVYIKLFCYFPLCVDCNQDKMSL